MPNLGSDVDCMRYRAAVVTLEGGYWHPHRPLWLELLDVNL